MSGFKLKGWRNAGLALVVLTALISMVPTADAVVLHGRGELKAAGNGLAVLDLRGGVTIRGAGLVIVAEDALVDVDGHGRSTDLGDGRILFEGFGRVIVRSPDRRTRVEAGGAKIRLRAKGRGRAFLKGCGVVNTDDVDAHWGPDTELEFEE